MTEPKPKGPSVHECVRMLAVSAQQARNERLGVTYAPCTTCSLCVERKAAKR